MKGPLKVDNLITSKRFKEWNIRFMTKLGVVHTM